MDVSCHMVPWSGPGDDGGQPLRVGPQWAVRKGRLSSTARGQNLTIHSDEQWPVPLRASLSADHVERGVVV